MCFFRGITVQMKRRKPCKDCGSVDSSQFDPPYSTRCTDCLERWLDQLNTGYPKTDTTGQEKEDE